MQHEVAKRMLPTYMASSGSMPCLSAEGNMFTTIL